MTTGEIPFQAQDRFALLVKIAKHIVEIDFPPKFSPAFRQIIEACLTVAASERPTAIQLLDYFAALPPLMSEGSPSLSPRASGEEMLCSEHASIQLSLHELNSQKDGTT